MVGCTQVHAALARRVIDIPRVEAASLAAERFFSEYASKGAKLCARMNACPQHVLRVTLHNAYIQHTSMHGRQACKCIRKCTQRVPTHECRSMCPCACAACVLMGRHAHLQCWLGLIAVGTRDARRRRRSFRRRAAQRSLAGTSLLHRHLSIPSPSHACVCVVLGSAAARFDAMAATVVTSFFCRDI